MLRPLVVYGTLDKVDGRGVMKKRLNKKVSCL